MTTRALCTGAESPSGFPSVSNQGYTGAAPLERLAGSDAPVLITGDSPNHRARVARSLHAFGPRAGGPFEAVSCKGLPEPLLEAELFGGRIRSAHTGTLFLDEVADLSLRLQGLILYFVETGSLRHLFGGEDEQTADVRLVAGATQDLHPAVASGLFRRDLFYRLNVLNLTLAEPAPPIARDPGFAADETREGGETPDILWDRMARGESFWSAVYPPFMGREITRADLRDVIRKGLSEARGNYTIVARLFNIEQASYRRFLSFLRKYDCQLPFRPFRQVP